MIRTFSRAFSTIQPGGSHFNLGSAWKRVQSAVTAPRKHLKRLLEPSGRDYSPLLNTTEEAFDEVAHEWQGLITSNPYDIQTFNMLEQVMIANFGTVDNPHVIFTADAPFRYVGCSGTQNEDDYEGHELLMFMLREGPLQRCPSCGQVFKLVRLRNEHSQEMDYYMSNFVPYDYQEMLEMDHTINMSILRFQKDSYEPSQFETPSNRVYTLVNADEHDRILTDPAYRLEKTKVLEHKQRVFALSLDQIEKEYYEGIGGAPRYPINKIDYETLFECEKAILKLDREFAKIQKFESRKFIDRENHERRERRMKERTATRLEKGYTLFYGGLTEEEQRYRDYFETDLQKYPDNEAIEEQLDVQEIHASGDYAFNKFDFQEVYTANPEEDASSVIEKKLFKFKFRVANDSIEVYQKRQERVITRQHQRLNSPEYTEILRNYEAATANESSLGKVAAEKAYFEFLAKETAQCFRDYYEDDKSEDFRFLDSIGTHESSLLIQNFENHVLGNHTSNGYLTFAKRPWSNSNGLWSNFFADWIHTKALSYDAEEYLLEIQKEARRIPSTLDTTTVGGASQQKQLPLDKKNTTDKK